MNKHFWNAVLSASDEEAEEMMEMLEVYEEHKRSAERGRRLRSQLDAILDRMRPDGDGGETVE